MPNSIKQSVGRGGRNLRSDVILVQTRLTDARLNVGTVDGVCGARTIAAIVTFQSGFMKKPDGLISQTGPTWQRLGEIKPQGVTGDGSYTSLIPRSSIGQFNPGLKAVNNTVMGELFGAPRASYGADCQPMTHEGLRRNVRTDSIGPFRVTGLGPAIDSLRRVFTDIGTDHPALLPRIGTAGMLCCRYQRGSTTTVSNHSWDTASI